MRRVKGGRLVAAVCVIGLLAGAAAYITHDRSSDESVTKAPSREDSGEPEADPVKPRPEPKKGQRKKPRRKPLPTCKREPGVFVVANYNIKAGRAFGRANLPQIAALLRDWSADVVLLQEVDRNRRATGGVDQAAWLAAQAGYDYYEFGANVTYGPTAAYGTAILSRHPVTESSNVHLPNLPGRQQRGLLRAVVDMSGEPISFYTTHFQHLPANAGLRTTQARSVVANLSGDPNPIVIGGDFNSSPRVPAMGVMRTVVEDTWTAAGAGVGNTVPSTTPRGRIDYVMHSGVTPLGAIVPSTVASDHRPIVAAFSYTFPDPDPCRDPSRAKRDKRDKG